LILARSEAHQSHHVVVPEELLTHVTTVTGERPQALIRADIVYFERRRAGRFSRSARLRFAAAFRTTATKTTSPGCWKTSCGGS
jgi:N,N-dimethylformamidase